MLFLKKIKQNKIYVLIVFAICIFAGVVYSFKFIPKEYISSATIMLIKTKNDSENLGSLELSDNLISTYEELIKSDLTIEDVKRNLDIKMENNILKKKLDIKRIENSDTFKIEVKNKDSQIALGINKEIVKIFSNKIKQMYSELDVYIIDSAHILKYSYGNLIIIPIAISIVVGMIINYIYILILIKVENKLKSKLDIENDICLKKLAEIPQKNNKKTAKSLATELVEEKTEISNAFELLVKNVQFLTVNNTNAKKVILVTSSYIEEGKTYVAANMGISFARAGKKVILIDANMNRGRLASIFNIPNNLGLSNYLSNLDTNGIEINEFLNKFINETSIKNLSLITSGSIPPNSSELLTSKKLPELIKDLNVFYDIIIIDGTPILTTTDALILTRISNSTIIVADYKNTKKEDLLRTKKDIQNIGGKIIGVVFNKIKIKKAKKTKEQRKEELKNFKSKIKSKVEKLKNRINLQRQKLLTETTTISENEEIKEYNIIQNEDKKEKFNFINLLKNNIKYRKDFEVSEADFEENKSNLEKNEVVLEDNKNNLEESEIVLEEYEKEFKENEIDSDKNEKVSEEIDYIEEINETNNILKEKILKSFCKILKKVQKNEKDTEYDIEENLCAIENMDNTQIQNENFEIFSNDIEEKVKTNIEKQDGLDIEKENLNSKEDLQILEKNQNIEDKEDEKSNNRENYEELSKETKQDLEFSKNIGTNLKIQKKSEKLEEKEFIVENTKNLNNHSESCNKEIFNNDLENTNKEILNDDIESYEEEILDEIEQQIPNGAIDYSQKIQDIKNKFVSVINTNKQNVLNFAQKAKQVIIEKSTSIKDSSQKAIENMKKFHNEKIDLELENMEDDEIDNQHDTIETVQEYETISFETNEIEIENQKENDENKVLVVVDAENAYCRVFSKYCFAEKLIRGIDKADGFLKANYSPKFLNRRLEGIMRVYDITKKQAERIDSLIYITLCDYDDCVWIEKKETSNKAEAYILCMAKEYEKLPGETKKEYIIRCQRLRKAALEKVELEIEYKLDNLWETKSIKLIDKINLKKFADFYEINNRFKNQKEILKSKNNKRIYNTIIQTTNNIKLNNQNVFVNNVEQGQQYKEEIKNEKNQENIKLQKRLQQEKIRIEKKQEQERIRNEQRKEKQRQVQVKKEENARRKEERNRQKEEIRRQKELEREKQREEAKIEEELLVDNLYPKTKHNKSL